MLKSFDESSTSLTSCPAGEAENDATICTTGNVWTLGFQFFSKTLQHAHVKCNINICSCVVHYNFVIMY